MKLNELPSSRKQEFILVIFMICGLFQGLFTEQLFGSLARSLGFMLLPLVFALCINKGSIIGGTGNFFIFLLIYALICLMYLFNNMTSYTISLLDRSALDLYVKTIYGHSLILLALYVSFMISRFDKRVMFRVFLLFLVIGLVGSILDAVNLIPSFLHHEIYSSDTQELETRPYGFFYEASSAVVTITGLMVCLVYSTPAESSKRFKQFFFLICIIAISWLYLIESKGGYLLLALSLLIIWVYAAIKNFKFSLIFLPVLLLASFIIYLNFESLSEYAIRTVMLTNTFTTRGLSIYAVMMMLQDNFFGYGPGIFLFEYERYLRIAYESLIIFNLPLNVYEIESSLNTGISLWPKGTFASLIAQYGIMAFIFFLILFVPIINLFRANHFSARSIILLFFYSISLLQFLFFANAETEYVFFLAFVLAYSYSRKFLEK